MTGQAGDHVPIGTKVASQGQAQMICQALRELGVTRKGEVGHVKTRETFVARVATKLVLGVQAKLQVGQVAMVVSVAVFAMAVVVPVEAVVAGSRSARADLVDFRVAEIRVAEIRVAEILVVVGSRAVAVSGLIAAGGPGRDASIAIVMVVRAMLVTGSAVKASRSSVETVLATGKLEAVGKTVASTVGRGTEASAVAMTAVNVGTSRGVLSAIVDVLSVRSVIALLVTGLLVIGRAIDRMVIGIGHVAAAVLVVVLVKIASVREDVALETATSRAAVSAVVSEIVRSEAWIERMHNDHVVNLGTAMNLRTRVNAVREVSGAPDGRLVKDASAGSERIVLVISRPMAIARGLVTTIVARAV